MNVSNCNFNYSGLVKCYNQPNVKCSAVTPDWEDERNMSKVPEENRMTNDKDNCQYYLPKPIIAFVWHFGVQTMYNYTPHT